MTRRGRPNSSPSVALFPFLAVLMCTMGALVLLLVVIARNSREQAAREHPAAVLPPLDELEQERAGAQWRVEQLRASRDKTAAELDEERADLSHLEDHARRLKDQLAAEMAQAAELARDAQAGGQSLEQLRQEMARTEAEIKALADELAENARKPARRQSESYAIIPYEGPNQTRRRPIYIECRSDAIILQPEGISLSESDFLGAAGAENPLAAALRAAREYLVRQARAAGSEGEPYPLLLVRPGGIGAYYAARSSMNSWGADFGYELIEDSWELEFKPPDAGLAEALARAVDESRRRQVARAMQAPRLLTAAERSAYRTAAARLAGGASGFGSFLPARSAGAEGAHSSSAGGTAIPAGGHAPGAGPAGGASPYAGLLAASAPAASPPAAGAALPAGAGAGPVGQNSTAAAAPSSAVAAAPGSSAAAYASVLAAPTGQAGGPGGEEAGGLRPARSPGTSSTAGNGGDSALPGGQPSGSSPTGNAAQAGPGKAAGGTTPAPGANPLNTAGKPYSASSGGTTAGGAASGSSGSSGDAGGAPSASVSAMPPTASVHLDATPPPAPDAASLAHQRGKNWSLPESHSGAVPVTRPIQLECHADRFVVLSERGDLLGSQVVMLDQRTADSMDALVAHIRRRIDSWGLAGRGMYWRPILIVKVQPDGSQRFADLQELLRESGLDVRRKATATRIPPPALPRR